MNLSYLSEGGPYFAFHHNFGEFSGELVSCVIFVMVFFCQAKMDCMALLPIGCPDCFHSRRLKGVLGVWHYHLFLNLGVVFEVAGQVG